MKKNNIFLEQLTDEEMKSINGGTLKCPRIPSYLKPGYNSGFIAWMHANCRRVSTCTPNTWTYCGK